LRTAGARQVPFDQLLRSLVGQYPAKCQNEKCEQDVTTHKHCTCDPAVYSLVIAHESESVSNQDIRRTLAAVEPTIDISNVYASEPGAARRPMPAQLRHINAYAFAHYVAFTWSEVAGKWLLRDDTMCRVVGSTFEEVVAKCVMNRYQPSLLIYERF
jgi:hypothetical protein